MSTRGPRNAGTAIGDAAQSILKWVDGLGVGDQLALVRWRSCRGRAPGRRGSAIELVGLGAARRSTTPTLLRRVFDVDDDARDTGRDLDGRMPALVVAPPIKSGIWKPSRSIDLATCTISSSDGVIRPDRPIMSTLRSRACLRISSHGDHDAQVDDLVIVARQDDADDVLADIMDVALDGRHQDPAASLALEQSPRFPSVGGGRGRPFRPP